MNRGHGQIDRAIGKRVATVAVHTEERDDVARTGGGDVFHLIGVHADQTADLDLVARSQVVDERSLLELALVHANIVS